MVERKTRLRGAQILELSVRKGDLTGASETPGHVATVQSDSSIDYVDTTSLAGVIKNEINI